MNKFLHLVLFLPLIGLSQSKKIQAGISTKDSAKLSILGVYQDDFPNISVVFRAEKKNGNPVFGLSKKDLTVLENEEECQVISIRELSKQKPINIGIVLDHSESMDYDEVQLQRLGYDMFDLHRDAQGLIEFPKGYVKPITLAKSALLEFVESFNFKKDNISVVGFSSTVDRTLGLTNNVGKIKRNIRTMKTDGTTAFYDAIIAGLNQLNGAEGMNVIVALTDGNDNASYASLVQTINEAKQMDIPVYVVGLGDVNRAMLSQIATETGGQFFYANSAKSLHAIYEKISEKLQSFYDLIYLSPNLSKGSWDRSLEISFVKEGQNIVSEIEHFTIDSTAIAYIKQKNLEAKLREEAARTEAEKAEEAEAQENAILNSGIGIAALLVAGGIIFYFSRKKSKPKLSISNVYPNPTANNVSIEIQNNRAMEGKLHVFDMQGNQVLLQDIGSKAEINLSALANGTYLLRASFDDCQSESIRVVVQK
jgi:Ca-activated chloride channel family protein